jgi:DnaJ homolog subfamily C member 19
MATPVIIGVGAIAAALAGRQLFRAGIIGGKKAADQWVKGGFKAKMDRKEAIAILGLKCVCTLLVASPALLTGGAGCL